MGRLTKAELTTAIDILSHPKLGDESDLFGAYTTARVAMKELKQYKDLEEQGRLIEQKHGTWESLDSYVYECDGMWQCSECGEDFYFEFGTPLDCRAYYCPNCGAKMELKELEGE